LKGEKWVTKEIHLLETFGHTPRSVSALVEIAERLVAYNGDAAIVKEDYFEFREPMVVTKNIIGATAVASLKRISGYKPVLVIPGYDAPFRP